MGTTKALTAEQQADAARLHALFEAWQQDRKARGEPWTQADVADEFGFESQSSVSQYIKGTIPLNPEALLKFARLLRVAPRDISPSIATAELRRTVLWLEPLMAEAHRLAAGEPIFSAEARALARDLDECDPSLRAEAYSAAVQAIAMVRSERQPQTRQTPRAKNTSPAPARTK